MNGPPNASTPFAALADETRREILKLLRAGSLSAGAVADAFDLSKPTISHHLKVLAEAGLVRSERRGTSIVYTLQTNAIEEIAQGLIELFAGAAGKTTKKKKARATGGSSS